MSDNLLETACYTPQTASRLAAFAAEWDLVGAEDLQSNLGLCLPIERSAHDQVLRIVSRPRALVASGGYRKMPITRLGPKSEELGALALARLLDDQLLFAVMNRFGPKFAGPEKGEAICVPGGVVVTTTRAGETSPGRIALQTGLSAHARIESLGRLRAICPTMAMRA